MKQTARAQRFVEAVGRNVRGARKALDLGQAQLGRRVGADAPTVSRIESGKKDLRLSEIFEVGRALGVSVSRLVAFDETP